MRALTSTPATPNVDASAPKSNRIAPARWDGRRAVNQLAAVRELSVTKKSAKSRTSRDNHERRHILRALQAKAGRPRWRTEILSATIVRASTSASETGFVEREHSAATSVPTES